MNTAIVEIGRGNKRKITSWSELVRSFLLPPGAEFLPQDYWEVVNRGGTGNKQNLLDCYDPSKHQFLWMILKRLGGSTMKALSWENGKRHYVAFIVQGQKTGRKLALVEADRTLNRLYAFDAEVVGWYETAQIGKGNFRPKNRQNYPEFKGAMNHNYSFKERLIKLVANY